MHCKFLKSQVDPQIQKSQTLEALNVNKSVNQSVKAVHADFRHKTRVVFYSTPETGVGKNLTPDGMIRLVQLLITRSTCRWWHFQGCRAVLFYCRVLLFYFVLHVQPALSAEKTMSGTVCQGLHQNQQETSQRLVLQADCMWHTPDSCTIILIDWGLKPTCSSFLSCP